MHLITIELGNLNKQTEIMPNNKKKRMSFVSSSKATNKIKKTKAAATLMEKKTLPQAKATHSKDKDEEEKNRKVYELSVSNHHGASRTWKRLLKRLKSTTLAQYS